MRKPYIRGNTNRVWSVLDPTRAVRITFTKQAGIGNISRSEITDGQQTLSVDTWAVTNRVAYNELGFAVMRTDGRGNSTTNEYDAVGRVVRTADTIGSVTSYGYDPMGRVIAITNAIGNVITRNYDDIGRDVGYSVNGERRTTLGYDPATGAMTGMTASARIPQTISTSIQACLLVRNQLVLQGRRGSLVKGGGLHFMGSVTA